MANAIKKSEPMREKQVDIVFDAAEAVKGQIEYGANRFKNLVGIDGTTFTKAKETITKNPLVKKFRTEVDEFVDEVTDSPMVKKAEKLATKIKVEVSDAIEEVKEKVTEVKDQIEDSVDAIIKGATDKSDLKIIDGIGPKLETVLNDAGINTYAELAKTSDKKLKEILEAAGPRYKMHNPEDWKAQAKLAAAGKMEEMAEWVKNKKASL